LTLEMKNLGVDAVEVAEFLRPRLKGKIDLHGKELRIEDAKAHDVKLLMHKFLRQKALDDHRVEVVHPGLVEVFPPEHVRVHEHQKGGGSPPSVGATMPYYFPGSPALSGSPMKKQKSKKKKEK
jgi:hypothetical protein